MMKSNFTPQELLCMALLLQKDKIYGILDSLGTDQQIVIQDTIDRLMEENVVHMDMDGHVFLDERYYNLVNTISNCSKFLTVQRREGSARGSQIAFWAYADRYLMADIFEAQYLFSWADKDTIHGLLDDCVYQGSCSEEALEIVVPQIQLVKALRLCQSDRPEEAIRLLRQNGVPEETAHVILDGLQRESYFAEMKYAEISSDGSAISELSFLASRGYLFSLQKTVLNLRSCTIFLAESQQEMHRKVSKIADAFFAQCLEE
jgi:hypothetical protein